MRSLLIFLVALLLAACTERSGSYPHRIMPTDLDFSAEVQDDVKQLFLTRCANCHGTLTEGRISRAEFFEPPAPDFTAASFRTVDPAFLYWRIAEGKTVEPYLSMGSVMPAWGAHFSEEKIWQIVAYLQTRSLH